MEKKRTDYGNLYRIKVRERLGPANMGGFGDITVIPQENGETLLTGHFPDQPALRGFLDQLWNLNFTVVSVEKVSNGLCNESAP